MLVAETQKFRSISISQQQLEERFRCDNKQQPLRFTDCLKYIASVGLTGWKYTFNPFNASSNHIFFISITLDKPCGTSFQLETLNLCLSKKTMVKYFRAGIVLPIVQFVMKVFKGLSARQCPDVHIQQQNND